MWKNLIVSVSAILLLLVSAQKTQAAEPVDHRIAQMNKVLVAYKSPMAGLEKTLIATAEKYNLDWTLLAAIAGTESSFGKRMPANCINPYGWGVYGANKICFNSLEDSIEGVAAGLAKKYNIASIDSIAHTYNKVSTLAWISHTTFFMDKIKNTPIPVSTLPVTL